MLKIESLSKRFGSVVALDGCSFDAVPGRILGLLGANGAGKTTAMRAIIGLTRLDGGKIEWDGRSVDRTALSHFGYMPEERGLYPKMKVAEQVSYFAQLKGLSATDAAAGAKSWIDRLGLQPNAERKVEDLSHGNQQRVQLAVALASGPQLLILDEPFSGLDPVSALSIQDVVREEARRGVAVIFSSHQLELVETLCDDIAFMRGGRIARSGTLAAVRAEAPYRVVRFTVASPPSDARIRDWVARLEGIELGASRGTEIRLKVPPRVDIAALLASARDLGEIDSFSFEPPSVAEIFMELAAGA